MESKNVFEFGPFRIDTRNKILTRDGEPVSLPAKAFEVFSVLVQESGQTVSKDRLMKQVWPDTFVEEGNLTQMIFLLRKALGDSENGQPLIVNVPRLGYRFTGSLTHVSTGDQSALELPVPDRHEPGTPSIQTELKRLWWIGAVIAIVSALGGLLIARLLPRAPAGQLGLFRYTISPEKNTTYTVGKISPDGRSLALMGTDSEGKSQLWVRRLDAFAAQPLTPAEFFPFWSPDSRFIAFANDGELKKIAAFGGAPQVICSAPLIVGGSWNREGTILFGNGVTIFQVPAKGGEAQPLTKLNGSRGEIAHDFPIFLPDGHHFLYTVHSEKKENRGIYIGSLESPERRFRLVDSVSNAEYASLFAEKTGHLLFTRGDVLMAQRFAPGDLQLEGEAVPVPVKITRQSTNLSASFSASENGILLVTAPYTADQITWFTRTGQRLGTIGRPGLHFYPQLSPDEKTVVVEEWDPELFLSDVWLLPTAEGVAASRFTFHGFLRPLWSPDGSHVAFESMDTGLYTKTSSGADDQTLVLPALNQQNDHRLPCEWSKDGRLLIYSQLSEKTGYDLWILPLFGCLRSIKSG